MVIRVIAGTKLLFYSLSKSYLDWFFSSFSSRSSWCVIDGQLYELMSKNGFFSCSASVAEILRVCSIYSAVRCRHCTVAVQAVT